MATTVLESLSNELAVAADKVGAGVVAIQAGNRIPTSGIQWRKGIIVTADHGIGRSEEIVVLLGGKKSSPARLAGRDPARDLAVLKIDDSTLPVPDFADGSRLKLANLVLALGRSWRGNLVASAGIIGGIGDEWITWRGGRLDRHIRLDLELYRGLSGGPLVDSQGRVVGINTSGLGRGRAITIPANTVDRAVDELLERGHISRPYLGLAMQPVAIPEALRTKIGGTVAGGLIVVHVEEGGPADKAGVLLGDIFIELGGESSEHMGSVQRLLLNARTGSEIQASVVRGGTSTKLTITLGDRPTTQ